VGDLRKEEASAEGPNHMRKFLVRDPLAEAGRNDLRGPSSIH